jgi:hypothetical protein
MPAGTSNDVEQPILRRVSLGRAPSPPTALAALLDRADEGGVTCGGQGSRWTTSEVSHLCPEVSHLCGRRQAQDLSLRAEHVDAVARCVAETSWDVLAQEHVLHSPRSSCA